MTIIVVYALYLLAILFVTNFRHMHVHRYMYVENTNSTTSVYIVGKLWATNRFCCYCFDLRIHRIPYQREYKKPVIPPYFTSNRSE